MKILVSNDDGFTAAGLFSLVKVMSGFGEVTVVAPKVHQSAMSMAVSLGYRQLAYKPLPQFSPGSWHYLDATPASCVKFGLEYFYEHRNPDLVICGINHGSNASSAANYSATLGATEEGALNGCRAIAVSICDYSSQADFSAVERRLPAIVKDLLDNWPEDSYGLFYNINFPKLPDSEIKGVKFARQGRGHWVKEFQKFDAERLTHYDPTNLFGRLQRFSPLEEGETGYMMVGDFVDDEKDGIAQHADHSLIEDGWITITPCRIDHTDYKELSRHI